MNGRMHCRWQKNKKSRRWRTGTHTTYVNARKLRVIQPNISPFSSSRPAWAAGEGGALDGDAPMACHVWYHKHNTQFKNTTPTPETTTQHRRTCWSNDRPMSLGVRGLDGLRLGEPAPAPAPAPALAAGAAASASVLRR